MDDRTEQDRSLVRATLRGEDEAYGELIERYQRMVAGVAWRYGAGADDIDDIVNIPVGESITYTIDAVVRSSATEGSLLTNTVTATVDTDSGETDPEDSNDSATSSMPASLSAVS